MKNAFVFVLLSLVLVATAFADEGDQGEDGQGDWEGVYDPYGDEAEVIPYFEIFVMDDELAELAYMEGTCDISFTRDEQIVPEDATADDAPSYYMEADNQGEIYGELDDPISSDLLH